MNCPRCGTTNHDNLANCVRCGAALVASDEAATFIGVSLPPTPAAVKPAADAAPPASGIAAMTPPPADSNAQTAGGWTAIGSAPGSDQVDFGPRYRIERLLGQGGMGAVYKAWDKELERPVALKLIRPELSLDPSVEQRFKQELLLASKISHKNILRIHDLGEAGGVKLISMAFVEGEDLHQLLIRHGKLPVDHALKITKQLCGALDAAHSEGVVHRDFKPQNILLDKQENVHVSDFGLAKSLESDVSMTKSGEFLGTPRYMAPEQVSGGKIDHRVDLYALGLILYEMVTGDVPFHADTTLQLMYKRVHELPKSPKTLNPDLPDWLVRVIMKCIERDPALRYQSAAEILHDLETGTAPRSHHGTVQIAIPSVGIALNIKKLAVAGFALIVLVAALLAVPSVRHKIFSGGAESSGPHKSVTILVADFTNHTGDPVFDGTIEPVFNVALEGASFINTFNRGQALKLARTLQNPSEKLDEQAARLVAVSQGVGAVITGEISRRGDKYNISAMALDAVTGNVLANAEVSPGNKDEVLREIPKLAAPIRKALGDTTPESVQLAAAETITAGSLEAAHYYSLGQEQQNAGKNNQALQSFSKAVELDPNFGRAYVGMSLIYRNLGQLEDARKYVKLALEHVDRMTDRERYRTRGFYYLIEGNFQKGIEEYSALAKQYPSDDVVHANLAFCYRRLGDMPRALEEGRRAVESAPKSSNYRMNLAIFLLYAGDFQAGEREARAALQLNSGFDKAYLALAYAQLGQGQIGLAAQTYESLGKINNFAASLAAGGLSDLALYEGRYSDAVRILEGAAATDLAAKRSEIAAAKFAALAHVRILQGQRASALAALGKALDNSKEAELTLWVGRLYAEAGNMTMAHQLAVRLASDPAPEHQGYAKLIDGEVALQSGDARKAIQLITDANKLVDSWIGHVDLGRAYLNAGLFVEADSEFDRCIRRRGEAIEIFVDDVPTYGYVPEVYYYQGRVRQGLKSPGFADSYRTYLNIRGKSGEDPLLPEIHRQLGE